MSATSRPMPWDEPSRLAFYGVDPGDHGDQERIERQDRIPTAAEELRAWAGRIGGYEGPRMRARADELERLAGGVR